MQLDDLPPPQFVCLSQPEMLCLVSLFPAELLCRFVGPLLSCSAPEQARLLLRLAFASVTAVSGVAQLNNCVVQIVSVALRICL